jgi:hypothetical protein
MHHPRTLSRTAHRKPGILAISLCAVLLVAGTFQALAQSGRKPPKRPSTTEAPPTSSQPSETQTATQQDSKPRIPVMVVKSNLDAFTSAIYPSVVIEGCLDRLHEISGLDPRTAKDMNRKEASDFAKKSSDTYVLWIELQSDRMTNSPTSGMDPAYARSLYVNYALFAPGADKTKASGHVYQRNRGGGGVPYPGQSPQTNSSAEYSLKYAGRETADHVLDALGLMSPGGVIRN